MPTLVRVGSDGQDDQIETLGPTWRPSRHMEPEAILTETLGGCILVCVDVIHLRILMIDDH